MQFVCITWHHLSTCSWKCILSTTIRYKASSAVSVKSTYFFKVHINCVGGYITKLSQKCSYTSVLATYPLLSIFSVLGDMYSYRHKTYQLSRQCADSTAFTWHNGRYARAQMDRGGAESTTFDLTIDDR